MSGNKEDLYKNIDDILSFLYMKILSKIEIGKNIAFYFLYQLPRLRSYSFLIGNDAFKNFKAEESISFQSILEIDSPDKLKIDDFDKVIGDEENENKVLPRLDNKEGILTSKELSHIINSAIRNPELIKLIDNLEGSVLIKECFTYHSKLKAILDHFNTFNFKKYQIVKESTEFPIFLRILLLCLPQLPSKYAYFSSIQDGRIVTFDPKGKTYSGIDKLKMFYYHIKEFNRIKHGMSFPDRLFLFISLLEGFFWNRLRHNDSYKVGAFFVGNLYEFLNSILKRGKVKEIIEDNSIYLKPIDFYFYGNPLSDESILQEEIKSTFNESILAIIQFSKFYQTNKNYIESRNQLDFVTPYWPKTLIHGLTNIIVPEKIHLINIENKSRSSYAFETEKYNSFDNINHELLSKPWAFYSNVANEEVTFYDLHESIIINDNKIIVNTYNPLNQKVQLIFEMFQNEDFKELTEMSNHFILNFKHYKYAFKGLVDKFLYINNSVILNSDSSNWFNRAFCDLYKKFDSKRIDENSIHTSYRKWEEKYFNSLFEKINIESQCNNLIDFIDMGIGYGRLEEKLKKVLGKSDKYFQLNFIGVDLSYSLLMEAERKNILMKSFHCDFRNIDYLSDWCKKESIKPNLICFIYTTFGYFKEDLENVEVLKKAYNLLAPGGYLVIEQFNPEKEPIHINDSPEHDKLENDLLIKTSNFIKYNDSRLKTDNYSFYYGNYVYYNLSSTTEEIVKCDSYEIKLYTDIWFNNQHLGKTDIKYFDLDGISSIKEEGSIMVIEIKREVQPDEIRKLNENIKFSLLKHFGDGVIKDFNKLDKIDKQSSVINSITENLNQLYTKLNNIEGLVLNKNIDDAYECYIKIK